MRTVASAGFGCLILATLGCQPVVPQPDVTPPPAPTAAVQHCKDEIITHITPERVFGLKYVPPRDHTTGAGHPRDTDMGGHSVDIKIDAKLLRKDSKLVVQGTVWMQEDQVGGATFTDQFESTLPGIASQCDIESAKPDSGELRAKSAAGNQQLTKYTGKELIKYATCLSDRKGDDQGKLGCMIEFQPVRVKFSPKH